MPQDQVIGARLKGKRALVIAAAQGIGRAIAERFVQEQAEVIACDKNAERLAELAPLVGSTLVFDASEPKALAAAVAGLRDIEILVNCAGIVQHNTILDTSAEEWALSFRINVDPMYHAIRLVLPGMLKAGRGSIINIGSVAGSVKGIPHRCTYGASKAAVIGLTKSVAADYARAGIRCNAICPGTIDTPSLQGRIDSAPDPVAARAAFIARQAMGRLGRPEEIAAVAAYLAADESAFTTGTVIIVDGGIVN